ncbi:hypothetical protein [Nostoc phage N1]|nr:hypothetical protein [Nostoc phage N1]
MSLELCYQRITQTDRVNGQLVDTVSYIKVFAGMLTRVEYNFTDFGTPDDWQPGENDLYMYSMPGDDNVYNVPCYISQRSVTYENGVLVSTNTKYINGAADRVFITEFVIQSENEMMPAGWSPTPGVDKILYEDVYDVNEER